MRPLSREVLARDAAARLAASSMEPGFCAGQGDRWTDLETRHRLARAGQARAVIEEVRREFCDGCPALQGCADWARAQEYTGLAAGAAYEEGQRQKTTWSVPRAGRGGRRAS